MVGDAGSHSGVCAKGNHRIERRASRVDDPVVRAPSSDGSALQRARARSHPAASRGLGRPARYPKVTSSGAIIPARAPPSMDILQSVMRSSIVEGAHGLPGELEDVPGSAAHPDAGDEREDDVLRGDARREPAVDPDLEGLRPALQQALRGEDVLHLARADAEGQCAEGPVGRRVAVAADDGHARLREPELRPHHVDDALGRAVAAVEGNAELAAVLLELPQLAAACSSITGPRVGMEWRPWRW